MLKTYFSFLVSDLSFGSYTTGMCSFIHLQFYNVNNDFKCFFISFYLYLRMENEFIMNQKAAR